MANDPFPVNKCKKLKGTEKSYRLRVGNYRVIYEVENLIKVVTVYHVRHRKDVYKK
ncbi:MAG: type II toxin-antitoxin system RelE/ParE family toxin [Bacteroidetes bacterium]|nr:type II toxin-antitoxin system RelE/ParE family toxin [Bacteroidota bacterium]MBT6685651.1 type II toxin-antitoxin system RelE/ParE family toxin [Bacteroidota bacterium]MBT7141875.1 type II toxin-antitoxin system RelE/ParE family toxin [Bacteroidota bacterium]MBT7491048.1 type II toxin-antitoxin system RelE/ParE family toxin [Bacteroidota bacterium]